MEQRVTNNNLRRRKSAALHRESQIVSQIQQFHALSQSDKQSNVVSFAHQLHECNKTSVKKHRLFLYFDDDHLENYINSDNESEDESEDDESLIPQNSIVEYQPLNGEQLILDEVSRIRDAHNFVPNSTLTSL